MTIRRIKLLVIAAGAAFGGLTLIAWTQPWFTLVLKSGQQLSVAGQVAAPALSALGLASLALAAALSIAGWIFRVVLGVVQVLIGVLVTGSAIAALSDPIAASVPTVTAAVGESGASAVAALVASISITAWPYLTVALGVLAASVGLALLATTRRWPGPTKKYEAGPAETATPAGTWDALSEGRDPT
jgi:hypothetical protein